RMPAPSPSCRTRVETAAPVNRPLPLPARSRQWNSGPGALPQSASEPSSAACGEPSAPSGRRAPPAGMGDPRVAPPCPLTSDRLELHNRLSVSKMAACIKQLSSLVWPYPAFVPTGLSSVFHPDRFRLAYLRVGLDLLPSRKVDSLLPRFGPFLL